MYAFPEMIGSLGLAKGEEWASDTHKTVAENLLCGRPGIDSRDHLMQVVGWINKQDEQFLRTATVGNLIDAGIPLLG